MQSDLETDQNLNLDTPGNEQIPPALIPPRKTSFLSKPSFWVIIDFTLILAITGIFIWFQFFQSKPLEPVSKPIGPNLQRVLNANELMIGIDATYPPMEYFSDVGTLVGHDIDLGNYLANELGVGANFQNILWDDIFNELIAGKIDIILSSVTITKERELKYAFSDPYLNAGQVIITKKAETSISSTADLVGKKIAIQIGTTNEQEALKYTSDELVIRYEDFELATQALIKGDADAIFTDLTNAKGIVDAYPNLKIASDPFTSEFYGIVFRRGEDDLVQEVNTALNRLRQGGILTSLKQKWLE